jgi:hypothetical protein
METEQTNLEKTCDIIYKDVLKKKTDADMEETINKIQTSICDILRTLEEKKEERKKKEEKKESTITLFDVVGLLSMFCFICTGDLYFGIYAEQLYLRIYLWLSVTMLLAMIVMILLYVDIKIFISILYIFDIVGAFLYLMYFMELTIYFNMYMFVSLLIKMNDWR